MTESRTKLPRNVKLLSAASLLNDVASEMIFPLLPQFFLTELGGNKRLLGVIEGLADTTSSLVKLFAGGWSDRAGRRREFILFGYLLAALSRPLCAFVGTVGQLSLVRLSDRVGKGVRTAPRDALIADSTEPAMRGRAFGLHRAMDHLGAAIGPLLAYVFLLQWPDRLRTLFFLAIVPGLLVVALLSWGLREEPVVSRAGVGFKFHWGMLGARFRWYLAAVVLFTLGNSSDMFLLVRVEELGGSVWSLPLLWCAFHVVKSTANLLAGAAADRWGARRMLLAGWLGYAAVYAAFALATNSAQGWGLFLLYAVCYALAEPAEKAIVAQLVGAEHKGLAYGWFNFAIGVSALPASAIFGSLYEWQGAGAAFGYGAAAALGAAAMLAITLPARGETL